MCVGQTIPTVSLVSALSLTHARAVFARSVQTDGVLELCHAIDNGAPELCEESGDYAAITGAAPTTIVQWTDLCAHHYK